MKVYIDYPGHITKMAAMPIYGKKHKKIFSGTGGPISMKLGMYPVVSGTLAHHNLYKS